MDEYSALHKSLPVTVPIQQSMAVIEERQECLLIANNRLRLAEMCGDSEGADYCRMIIKAIESRSKA